MLKYYMLYQIQVGLGSEKDVRIGLTLFGLTSQKVKGYANRLILKVYK
jgi:hypothetical protein